MLFFVIKGKNGSSLFFQKYDLWNNTFYLKKYNFWHEIDTFLFWMHTDFS